MVLKKKALSASRLQERKGGNSSCHRYNSL
jgi:hypothetical protein